MPAAGAPLSDNPPASSASASAGVKLETQEDGDMAVHRVKGLSVAGTDVCVYRFVYKAKQYFLAEDAPALAGGHVTVQVRGAP
jgi:hypothetical protein